MDIWRVTSCLLRIGVSNFSRFRAIVGFVARTTRYTSLVRMVKSPRCMYQLFYFMAQLIFIHKSECNMTLRWNCSYRSSANMLLNENATLSLTNSTSLNTIILNRKFKMEMHDPIDPIKFLTWTLRCGVLT